ncbi:hypothetical protein KJ854_01680 [Patescibacteria group bacterium]|nr:hypothetical protein [Patescibacteria group bacterium]MCG2700689.1 hypothetical protein [Candidatus Parcubacteria bacterium]
MLKKIQPIYIVSILTVVFVIVGLFIARSLFGLNKETLMSIGAVILAPVIAIIVGEYLRQRTERQREEYETLKTLVSFRHTTGSHEFLGALNRVVLVFDKNKEIKNLVKELWNGYVNAESPAVSKRRQIELIYATCKHMKRDVTEFEIDNFFIPTSVAPTPAPVQSPSVPQNPNSTVSDGNNFITKANSQNNYSITAGSFLEF